MQTGFDPTPHFRPLYAISNARLFELFGTEPAGWYLCGLLVHAANACLVAYLAGRVSGRALVGFAAGVAFAAFYSPNEAVAWVSANLGLFCVFFVLLGGAACIAAE